MTGVDTKIHDDLVNLGGIPHYIGLGFDLLPDLNSGGQGGTQQFHRLLDNQFGLQHLGSRFLLPAQREDMAHQLRGSFVGLLDLLQIAVKNRVRRYQRDGELRIARCR